MYFLNKICILKLARILIVFARHLSIFLGCVLSLCQKPHGSYLQRPLGTRLYVLFKVGAVHLRRDGDELFEERVDAAQFLLARLPVHVMIPKLVRTELQSGARDRTVVQTVGMKERANEGESGSGNESERG